MGFGQLGLWEILLLLIVVGPPLWAIIATLTAINLTLLTRILMIVLAVFAPVIGPIIVLVLVRREAT
jgi:hypothetical protein